MLDNAGAKEVDARAGRKRGDCERKKRELLERRSGEGQAHRGLGGVV